MVTFREVSLYGRSPFTGDHLAPTKVPIRGRGTSRGLSVGALPSGQRDEFEYLTRLVADRCGRPEGRCHRLR